MRRAHLVFLVAVVLLLTFAIRSVFTLLTLLVEDASADAIPGAELEPLPRTNSTPPTRPLLIPKILHQTYVNETIPARWRPAQRSCVDLHPDYQYILWTDETAHAFITEEYPWFLQTFESYDHNIQRADAIRYFALAHHGGVYLDLDDGCRRRLDPLLTYGAWLRRTVPTGISNDAMGATPGHPFFLRVIRELQNYDAHWVLPYITIMASTGPLFLSVVWKRYLDDHARELPGWAGRVRVLMPAEYKSGPAAFFHVVRGDSWHGDDARLIFWMGSHWMFLTALGFALGGVLGVGVWWLYGRLLLLGTTSGKGGSPQMAWRRRRLRLPAWWRRTAKLDYELLEQHSA